MSQVRRALSSLALPLLAAWGLGAACYNEPLLPVFGYENDELSCSDSADNDADCLVDCEDPDCLVLSTVCGEVIPEFPVDVPENPYFCQTVVDPDEDGDGEPDRIYAVCTVDLDLCRDRVDNDANGQFDCGDRKCQDVFETGCLPEATNELCSDGIDNDQNGFADCQDFGCTNSPIVDVCDQDVLVIDDGQKELRSDRASCVENVDTDNDGKIGCEDDCDRECSPSLLELEALGIVDDPEFDWEFCCEYLGVIDYTSCAHSSVCGSPENSAEACLDDVDNDEDGYVDCDDRECLAVDDTRVIQRCDDKEDTLEECSDGADNDRDGDVDCADPECSQSAEQQILDHCNGEEASLSQCTDGIDNDGNDFTDCEDFSCSMSPNPELQGLCGVPEETLELCMDGEDNDKNGFVDCADFGCSMSDDPAVVEMCEEQLENTPEKCSDKLDNDGNGFTDCDDFSCSRSDDPELQAVCPSLPPEDTPEACGDGEDNDNNGFVDCEDFSCSRSDDPEVLAVCEGKLENTPAACSDGIDNNGNGFIDCQDFSCSQSDDFAVLQACKESLGVSNAETDQRCSDGLDNDADGFVDCDDFDCSHNIEVTVCPVLPYCETGRSD